MTTRQRRRAGILTAMLIAGWATTALAYPAGITTLSFPPVSGCNKRGCHSGGETPTVTIEGPLVVAPGGTAEYLVRVGTIGSQHLAGLNAAVTVGTLAVGGANAANTQTMIGGDDRPEITHTVAKGPSDTTVDFSFRWQAPDVYEEATLTVWGNAVDGNRLQSGDRAAVAELVIAVASPQPTPTATPLPGGPCVGDCNDDREVTIDELITGVNVALGAFAVTACEAFDAGQDGEVTIDELMLGVNNALNGCR